MSARPMDQQPPLLTPDQAQVFAAVFLLRPCTRNTLVSRLHLPVKTIDHCLTALCERGLLSILSPPVHGGIKGGLFSPSVHGGIKGELFSPSVYGGIKGGPPLYDLHAVDMYFAQLAEVVILPILDENRQLREQRNSDLEYQAAQHQRVRNYEIALFQIAAHESEEGQIASTALHSSGSPPVDGGTKGGSPYDGGTKGGSPYDGGTKGGPI